MRKMKYIIGILLLFMVIGFATVTVSLSISGNVKVVSDVDDFKVYFSDAKLNGTSTPALIESATSLSFDVDFGNLGTQHVIEYDVTNASKLFDAVISMSCTQSNEYLSVVNEFDTSNLSALSTRTGTLTLTKTKSNASETNTDYAITCEIVASPVERDSEAIGDIPNSIDQNYAVLKATTQDDTTAFRSATYKSKIKTLTFEDEINVPETATESWDLGVNQNGNVMAYVIPNTTDSTYYDLYIQSDTQLYANRDMSYWFAALTYVDEINNLELLDTSKTTNMLGMFSETGQNSTVFTLDVSNFDTSSVINMSGMFFKTGNASTVFTLDVSNFDTSSVIDMGYMFTSVGENNPNFTLDVSGFDTTNVTNMYGMFWYTGRNSTIFTLDVSNFDTSNVTNMGSMFAYAGKNSTLFTLDVSNFDTSNVTNMGSMFNYSGYTNPNFTLDVSNFDTSNVTNMGSMFKDTGYNSTVLQLDVSGFDTSNVTSMNYMFDNTGYNSTVLQLDVSKFNTSKVTSMVSMFSNTGYTNPNFTLDVSKFDTSNVTRMENMFSNTGYNSTKLNTTITIRKVITNPRYYSNIFNGVATKEGSKITVNYTSETSDLVDKMIATKSSTSNVVKGYNESSVISFTIDGATYNAYEGMTWGQWVDSEYNTDLEFNIITFGGSDKLVPAPTDYYEPGVALHYGPAPQSTETVIQHGYAYTLGCD